jgi:hypothetical protein
MPMTDYFDFADVKSLMIGVIGGVIVLAIQRLWLIYSVKGAARRLREAEAYKSHLDNLAKSDRALLVHAFAAIFFLLGMICLLFGIETSRSLYSEFDVFVWAIDLRELLFLLLWVLVALLCFGVGLNFHRLADYPKSAEKLDKRIAKLKDKVSGKSGPQI